MILRTTGIFDWNNDLALLMLTGDKMNVIASTKDTSALNDRDAEKYIPLKHLFENHHPGKGDKKKTKQRGRGTATHIYENTQQTPIVNTPPTPSTAAQTRL